MQGARITLRVCRTFLLKQARRAADRRHSTSYSYISGGGNTNSIVALLHVLCTTAPQLLLSVAPTPRRGAAMISGFFSRSEARSQKAAVRWSTRIIPVFIFAVIVFACWAVTKSICSECSRQASYRSLTLICLCAVAYGFRLIADQSFFL